MCSGGPSSAFGLDRIIRTKSGPMGGRKDATNRYREQIYGRLPFLEPSLEDSDALEDLVNADLGGMNGSRLGELESKLDAVISAYVAAFLDIRGPEASAFLGS